MQVIFGLFAPHDLRCHHARKAAIASRICRLCLKRKPTRPHNLLLPVPESSANLLATDTGRHRPARWQLHVSYIWAIRAARPELPSRMQSSNCIAHMPALPQAQTAPKSTRQCHSLANIMRPQLSHSTSLAPERMSRITTDGSDMLQPPQRSPSSSAIGGKQCLRISL